LVLAFCLQTVNQKKLEKAEQKIREKQEKRAQQETMTKAPQCVFDRYSHRQLLFFLIRYQPNSASASQQSSRRDNKMESSGTNKSYDIRIENFDVSFGDK
jgi:ATP-binding cassette subfamily F protein 3